MDGIVLLLTVSDWGLPGRVFPSGGIDFLHVFV